VTPSTVVVGYQRFGGPCCIHFQDEGTKRSHSTEEIDLDFYVLFMPWLGGECFMVKVFQILEVILAVYSNAQL